MMLLGGHYVSEYGDLRLKSEHNYKIGQIAQNSKYYDVAVSRFYYSLFQLIEHILFNKKNNIKIPRTGGSHNFTIEEFNKYIFRKCKKKLTDQDYSDLTVFDDLKRWRHQADYNRRFITETEFTNDFLKKFESCYSVIDSKLVVEVDE